MKAILRLCLIGLLFLSGSLGLNAQQSFWTQYSEIQGIQIFTKTIQCNDPSMGVNNEMVMLKFVNTTQQDLMIQWTTLMWYNNQCHNCNDLDGEYRMTLQLPAGNNVEADCGYSNNALKIYSRRIDIKTNPVLTRFELDNIIVTPY